MKQRRRRALLTLSLSLAIAAGALIGAQSQAGNVEPPVLIKKDGDDWITDILFTPDGRYLLTASTAPGPQWKKVLPNDLGEVRVSYNAIVKIWEVPRGNLVRTLQIHHGGMGRWTISTASGLLATGGTADEEVKLWEIPSGRLVRTLEGTHPMGFSADGSFLWVSHRRPFSIVDGRVTFETADAWAAYDVHSGAVIARSKPMLLAPGGRIGAVVSNDEAEIRDTLTGTLRKLPVSWGPLRALSGDGSRFALARGSEQRVTLEVWDVQTGRQLWMNSSERTAAERSIAARIPFNYLDVPNLLFSPDGATLIGWNAWADNEPALRVWDVETGRARSVTRANREIEMQVRDVVFTADGSLIAVRRTSQLIPTASTRQQDTPTGTVTLVRLSTLEPVAEIRLQPDAADVAITRDASHMATRERDGNVRLWRMPPVQ